MKIKLLLLAICFSAFTFAASAQDKPDGEQQKTESKTAQKLTAKDYQDLLDKLKKGDTSIDFVKLRLAYTETEDYSPYGGSDERAKIMKALGDKKYKDVLKATEKMLETNYVDLHSHYAATIANKELKKEKEASFHQAVFKGLMEAVFINDGLTAKTGIISLGISEQYFIMGYLGFERQGKSLVNENGSMFDLHTAYNSKTKETRKFYFNIDKVLGRF